MKFTYPAAVLALTAVSVASPVPAQEVAPPGVPQDKFGPTAPPGAITVTGSVAVR